MRKNLLLLSSPLLLLGALRILAPQTLFRFAGLDSPFGLLALAIASGVLLLTSHWWERIDFRRIFGLAAAICLVLTIALVNSPTLWGLRSTYLSLLDIFVILDSGLLFALAALEEKDESLPAFAAAAVYTQLLMRRWRRIGRIGAVLGQGWQTPHYNS